MRIRHLVHVVGLLLVALSSALLVTAGVAGIYGDGDAWAFLTTAVGSAGSGYLMARATGLERELSVREGYAVVAVAWISVATVGAVPYVLTGVLDSPTMAFFESISGFTTTGATVFAEIDGLPHGVLFWRNLTQWLGGMGIIVLGVAILPFLGVGGMQLFRAEVPGPTYERLRPRIAQTAKLLWLVYAGLTAAEAVLFLAGGMSVFDAVTHSFTTLSTGGFTPHTASMRYFDSPYIHYVTILFMYLAGVNFTLHFRALQRGPGAYADDPEWGFFTRMVLGAFAVVFLVVWAGGGSGGGLESTVRDTLFQVVSIGTTTGFVSADYEEWALGAQVVLLLLMFAGGSAGSTGGGVKSVRIMVLVRQAFAEFRKSVHPRAVILTRVGKTALEESTVLRILSFLLLFLLLFAGGVLALALLGHDLVTAVGASAASIGNIGPGLGEVGAVDHYGWMDPASHLLLCFLMLAGRLEIFTVLLLFHPELWRRRGS